ncbi:APC family permease [Streptomyces sp. NPDC005811]|uniref:APC family permease n=1 Tax=Streptomyces sp. NPDC005811 TaxID=3154565 RepID=UPI0033EEE93F
MTISEVEGRQALKENSVGAAGIVFFVVAAAAPLAASVATAPIVFGYAGLSAPLAYVAVGVILLLFSVGYALMSHHVTSAAGLAAFVERALGRKAGFASAFIAVLSYGAVVMGIYGGFGFFASYSLEARFDFHVSWFVCAAVAWALVSFLGYRAVEVSARLLGVLLVLEIGLLVVFDIVSTARGGAQGVGFDGFVPTEITSGSGFGVALLFAAVAFLGFEATAIYGEEAKSPRKTIATATYVSVLIIAVFYAITMWALGNAYGGDRVVAEATKNPGGLVLDAMPTYLGHGTLDIANALVVTSYFAALLALHNTLARYMMSLGRAGGLPKAVGGVHARWQSPHTASLVVSAVTALVVGAFAAAHADPFLQLFGWLTGIGTLGIFVLQAAASVAVVVYFRRHTDHGPGWSTLVAPTLAFLGLGTVLVLALRNWALLSGATAGLPTQLPWLVPIFAAAGVAVVVLRKGKVTSLAGGAGEGAATGPNTSSESAIGDTKEMPA